MEGDIMGLSTVSLDEFVSAVKADKCPFCRQYIDIAEFKTIESLAEYEITNMCMNCQNETFNTEEK